MKKWFALVLVLILIPACTLADIVRSTDQFGNDCYTYTDDDGEISYTVTPESFPFSFDYNGKEVVILRADFYQAKIGYGYYPFYHIKLDVSQLTDDEIYWMRKVDMDILLPFYVPNLDAGSDAITYLSKIVNVLWTDIKEIDIILYGDKAQRYSLEGCTIFCTVNFKHPNGLKIPFNSGEVTIEDTDIDLNRTDASPCDFSEMDSGVYNELKEALSEKGLKLE